MYRFDTCLKAYRLNVGLSQSKLAEAAGLDHSYVSRLESGARTPIREVVERLRDPLGLTPDEHDALLRSAGYIGRAQSTDDIFAVVPELRDLAQMLTDESVPRDVRGGVRLMLATLCQLAYRRNLPAEAAP